MKHSIRFKMTFLLTSMLILTIFITWIINRTFLDEYYLHSKMNNLNGAFQEISDIFIGSGEGDYLTEYETGKVEHLESIYNVDVYVFDPVKGLVFPSPNNIGDREQEKMIDMLLDYSGYSNPDIEDKKLLKKTDSYFIFKLHDKKTDTNYIDMIGIIMNSDQKKGDTNVRPEVDIAGNKEYDRVLIRSNLESIEESVAIANKFLAYVGIIAAIIGTLAMFSISKRFTKPILDLAGIAKKMSDLNFEVKYKVKSKDEIGELGSSVNTLSDKLETTITELKQANNELLTDIQKKTEIDEMRKEFLSNVSHELKTPISLIQGYAEGLKENINEDQEGRDFYCEVIMDEAGKMNQMVKKLLSLNEIEFGNKQVNFERFDIVALIRSVLDTTEILFRQKGVILHFEQTEPIYVWADEYMVEQVVTNYISNALNHVSGQKIIEIKLIPRDDTVRVAVFNTGDTIPEEDLDKIWIKFYKVDKARTREYGGSGIGLSIVKAIMNSLNRECGVINRSIGVEFWFELDTKS